MESTNRTLSFRVNRNKPEMIAPAKPTPHEFKALSDIDDQDGLRFHIPIIQFYERKYSMQNKDPVNVIRNAIAKTLVFYYPFAGRLREFAARKLVVECTGEGVLFIEANADVTLQDLGHALHPPFSYLDKLLYHVPGSSGIINCPLLLIQVTRLKCGGFVFALRLNHTMSDAAGLFQFTSAIGELARGAQAPTVTPVWQRHLLSARDPPRVTCTHSEYHTCETQQSLTPPHNLVERAFFFSATDISALRSNLPPHLRHRYSRFELVLACIWWCRTVALSLHPNEEIRISCLVNCRNRFNPPLPQGYYGNAIVYPAAVTTAGKLSENSWHYALELVRNTISQATQEYAKSVADLMATKNRPPFKVKGTYMVSDVTRAGLGDVDFGWGKAAYAGPAEVGIGVAPGVVNFISAYKDGMVVPTSLPENAMGKFVNVLHTTMEAARKGLLIAASAL